MQKVLNTKIKKISYEKIKTSCSHAHRINFFWFFFLLRILKNNSILHEER